MSDSSIPVDFPLHLLVGQELTQVCIGSNDVRLSFYQVADASRSPTRWEPGAVIDIEAGFELFDQNEVVGAASNAELGARSGCLTAILRQTILSADRLPANELSLGFSGGMKLRLTTDPVGFESYHLLVNGERIDVAVPRREP